MDILALLILFVFVPATLLFGVGLRALYEARRLEGERAQAMRYLALNACEPLINTFIVGGLIFQLANNTTLGVGLVLCTAPMAVLLLPARGMRLHDSVAAGVSAQLLMLGAARWLLSILTIGLSFFAPNDDVLPITIGPTLVLAGLALLLLYASIFICLRLRQRLLGGRAVAIA